MNNIAVIVPTYHRARRLERVAKNIHDNTQSHTLYFVCEPGDTPSIKEIEQLGELCIINKVPGTHTGAANTAYQETCEPFFIIANDDFNFTLGWDVAALEKMNEGFSVVGLNDCISDSFTQITLVRRSYIETQSGVVDEPNTLYHSGYHHNYVDTEFAEVAMMRGVYIKCPESRVEHKHWTKGAPMDETYKKTFSRASHDQRLYQSRRHLWTT